MSCGDVPIACRHVCGEFVYGDAPVDPFIGILKAVLGLREANQVPVLLHSGDPEGVCRGKIQTGRSGGELYFHC